MMKNIANSTIFPIIGFLIIIFFANAFPNYDKKAKIGIKKGNQAPEIELYSIDGQLITLSSLRGSVVFIDFWASWCKGCREVSKSLNMIYDDYKDQEFVNGNKFQILSVCLDTDRKRWLDVMEKDSLHHFINVSDLKGFKSRLAEDYKLIGLPKGYLIDGDGIILGDLGDIRSILREICISR